VRLRTPARRRPGRRGAALAALTCSLGAGLLVAVPAGGAQVVPPLDSAVSTSSGSWVVLAMGDLSQANNTFWELLHSTPGSSHWSLVTPPGVADNGGLVVGASAGSVVAGVLPSQLLDFSPLAQSGDGGASWGPVFFPGALAPRPDALAYEGAAPGGAIAITAAARAVAAPVSLSTWTPLVSARALARVSPRCGVSTLSAAAILPSGAPLIGVGCRRGGLVGIFTRNAGSWQPDLFALGGSLRGSATSVLRLQVTGATTTALISASRVGHRALIALWRRGDAPWTASAPLVLGSGESVVSSAASSIGTFAVLLGSLAGGRSALEVTSGGPWTRLPRPPPRTATLALPAAAPATGSRPVDAFTADGGSLGVYALTSAGTAWSRVQSSQIAIPYGSSS
jgi:hypothetical protein